MNISFFSTEANAAETLSALKDRLRQCNVTAWPDIANPADLSYAICWGAPERFFDGANNLKAVFSLAAGVDHLLEHPGLPEGVPIIRLQDAGMADKIAEYVHFGVIRWHRHFHDYQTQQAQKIWQPLDDIANADYRVGIMGMGIIGCKIAARLAAAGYDVSGWKRTVQNNNSFNTFAGGDQLPEFLKPLDALVCVLPLTAETTGIINRNLLAYLPKGACFINVGRGGQVVESDLLDALNEGQLGGAMLDVCESEPPQKDHPFWLHPNILLTPHIAGPTQLNESVDQIAHNIERIESGVAPEQLGGGLVFSERGY